MEHIINRHHGIALLVLGALFFYFGNGAMSTAKINGGMNENSWMWYPTISALLYGITLSLMIFRNYKIQVTNLQKQTNGEQV